MNAFLNLVLMNLYLLIPNDEALLHIQNNGGTHFFDFPQNQASAYELEDGRIIVLPEHGDSSMLFSDKKLFAEFQANPVFPPPHDDPFYPYREEFKNLEKNMHMFFDKMNKELDLKIDIGSDFTNVKDIFSKLNIAARGNNADYEKLIIPSGIVIGELLKRQYDFAWKLEDVYTFDRYQYPVITNNKGREFWMWAILEEFFEDKKFDFADFQEKLDIFMRLNK